MRKRANFGGNSISYLRCGDGYPVLLLHALHGEAAQWAPSLPALSEHVSVYALDLPGRGESFSVEERDYPALLARFLEHLGIAHAHVVAAPDSAALAQEAARRFPRKIRQVVVADPNEADSILDLVGRRQSLTFEW